MPVIKLSNHGAVQVSVEDFEELNQWSWTNYGGYAVRYFKKGDKLHREWMHRVVNKTPASSFTDHINGDKLDNRRGNLRTANHAQNMINYRRSKKSSQYTGVHWVSSMNRWEATVTYNKRKICVGYFRKELHAALARDMVAFDLQGAFAILNFPNSIHG